MQGCTACGSWEARMRPTLSRPKCVQFWHKTGYCPLVLAGFQEYFSFELDINTENYGYTPLTWTPLGAQPP